MRPWLKWIISGLVLVLVVAGAMRAISARNAQKDALALQQETQRVPALMELSASDLVVARMTDLPKVLAISGPVKAVNSAMVKVRVAGELQDLRVRPRTASVRSPSTSLVFASTRLLVFIMSPLGVQDGPCRRNRKLDAHLQCTMRGTHNQARILLPWVSSRPVHCMQRHRKSNTVSVVYGTFPTTKWTPTSRTKQLSWNTMSQSPCPGRAMDRRGDGRGNRADNPGGPSRHSSGCVHTAQHTK